MSELAEEEIWLQKEISEVDQGEGGKYVPSGRGGIVGNEKVAMKL